MLLEYLLTSFDKSLIFQLLPWMLKEMWNFECSTVAIVTLLVLTMEDKVKELSNLGLKVFAIGAGDEEVFADDDSSVGDCTVGESFGVCCPGLTSTLLRLRISLHLENFRKI